MSDINSVDIAVINAPNMAINHERIKFLNIVNKFSKANCTQHGNNSIDFWYFGYKDYIDQLGFADFWTFINNDPEVSLHLGKLRTRTENQFIWFQF